jgi:hypothetical protein
MCLMKMLEEIIEIGLQIFQTNLSDNEALLFCNVSIWPRDSVEDCKASRIIELFRVGDNGDATCECREGVTRLVLSLVESR